MRLNKYLIKRLLRACWLYSFILWLYVVSNVYVFPADQLLNLSYYVPIPTNLLGVSAFAASFIFLVLLCLAEES